MLSQFPANDGNDNGGSLAVGIDTFHILLRYNIFIIILDLFYIVADYSWGDWRWRWVNDFGAIEMAVYYTACWLSFARDGGGKCD